MTRFILTAALLGGLLQYVFGEQPAGRKRAARPKRARGKARSARRTRTRSARAAA
jgi:hypothetical protein